MEIKQTKIKDLHSDGVVKEILSDKLRYCKDFGDDRYNYYSSDLYQTKFGDLFFFCEDEEMDLFMVIVEDCPLGIYQIHTDTNYITMSNNIQNVINEKLIEIDSLVVEEI
jgi:hypothetical protein